MLDEFTTAHDDDGDGYCEGFDLAADGTLECSDNSLPGDCDDHNSWRSPARVELADGVDNDCDPAGVVDNGTNLSDDDGDGYTESGGDCDDSDPNRRPGILEQPNNNIDDNCNGQIDEPFSP